MTESFTLVTGASSGIGRAFALHAAAKGRNLILTARSEETLDSLAGEIRDRTGGEVHVIAADLAAPGAAGALWSAATADGRAIDLLVNNAGLGRHGAFGDRDADAEAREAASIQVNIAALTDLMRLAVVHMKDRSEGRVLNIASVAGFMPGPGMAVYHATKSYVVSLSQAVNAELEGTDISITAFCPGATKTGFFDAAEMLDARVTKLGGVPSAKSVAEAAYDAAIRRDTIATPGFRNKFSALAGKMLPGALSAGIARWVLAKA